MDAAHFLYIAQLCTGGKGYRRHDGVKLNNNAPMISGDANHGARTENRMAYPVGFSAALLVTQKMLAAEMPNSSTRYR